MAEQSPVQQLIQSLAGIQTTAQQNASNAANNGNPNTVYNTSAWGYGGPPVMDSNGAWSTNQFSPAAVLQAQNLNFGSWQPPAGTGSTTGGGWGNLRPVLPPNIADPNWVAPPVTTPPGGGGTTTPPTTTPPTGGGGTPVTGGNGGVNDYPLWNGPGGGWSPPGGTPTTHIRPPTNTGGGTNSQGINFSNDLNSWLSSGGGRQLIGTNQDGSLSWQQIVDMVSEPWMPGNMFMSQTGQWNTQNILTALANTIIPGAGSLLNFLADKGLFGKKAQEWVRTGQYAELGNTVLGFLNDSQELSQEENPVGSVLDGYNSQFPDTPYGNFGLGQFFGSGGSWGYTPPVRTPTVNVGNPTTVTGNPTIEGPSSNPSRPNNNNRGNNNSGSSSSGNSGNSGSSGSSSNGGGIENDANWQSLQNALNNASIYWMLDSTSRQAQEAMRRMFANQRQ